MNEFDKNLRTTQCMGGGIEVATTVIVDGKIKQLFKRYDLNVPEAVEQFKKDFAEYRPKKSQQEGATK